MEENKLGNLSFNSENMRIKSNKSIYCDSFYFIDVFDDNSYKKFIKGTERLIRQSKEYRKYIELLRTNFQALNYDSVLSNISSNDANLEFHHYPLSLYEIVDVLVSKHIINKDNITSFSIAKEVMEYHYKNKIGLVPFSEMNHKLAHMGALFIHKKQIYGNYESFVEENKIGVSSDLIAKLNKLDKMSDSDVASDFKGLF